MNNDPIQHLRELLEKATPGPWNGDYLWRLLRYGRKAGFYEAESDGENPNTPEEGDAALIVALRNAAPTLLAVADAARAAAPYVNPKALTNECYTKPISECYIRGILFAALAKLDEVKHD